MMCNDPIYLAKYENDNYLIDNPGQKHLRTYTNNTKNMNRLLKAAKAKHRSNTVKTKFGMKIPHYMHSSHGPLLRF